MKRFRIIVACLVAGVSLASCAGGGKADLDNDVPVVDIFNATEEISDISKYVADVKIVRLSADSVYVPGIVKLLTYEDKILLLNAEGVYEFKEDGTFSRRIGRVGRGPGEYIHLNDFCIDDNGKDLLCLTHHNEVLRYSLDDGHFIGDVTADAAGQSSDAIFPVKGGGFAIFFANPSGSLEEGEVFNHLRFFDRNGKVQDEVLERTDFCVSMGFRPFSVQSLDNSYVLSFGVTSGPCYVFSKGEVSSLVNIDLGKNALPAGYFLGEGDPWMKLGDAFEGGWFKCPAVCRTKGQYYVTAFGKDSSVWNFVTDGKRGIRWESVPDMDAPISFVASDEDGFYFVYSETCLTETSDALKKYLIDSCGLVLSGDDNPAIVKVRFKI